MSIGTVLLSWAKKKRQTSIRCKALLSNCCSGFRFPLQLVEIFARISDLGADQKHHTEGIPEKQAILLCDDAQVIGITQI